MKEATVKMNKSKSWFFEEINKIDKSLARLTKEKREKNQLNKIRNEKGEFKGQCTNKRVIRDDSEQLYASKMDNLEEMDRFLERFSLPGLNQNETEIMKKPITSTEIKSVIKNLPRNKSPGQMDSRVNSIQTFRVELMSILLKLLQKIAEEGALPSSFYKATIILIPKPDSEVKSLSHVQLLVTPWTIAH